MKEPRNINCPTEIPITLEEKVRLHEIGFWANDDAADFQRQLDAAIERGDGLGAERLRQRLAFYEVGFEALHSEQNRPAVFPDSGAVELRWS